MRFVAQWFLGQDVLYNSLTVQVVQVLEDYQSPADLERQAATGTLPRPFRLARVEKS